jgi:hypothetical protein
MSDRPSLSIFTIEIDGKPTLAFEAKRYAFSPAACALSLSLATLKLMFPTATKVAPTTMNRIHIVLEMFIATPSSLLLSTLHRHPLNLRHIVVPY